MNVGIGLPAAVPDVDATIIADWVTEAERGGFASLGVIDRLVYDNLEPLTALAAAVRTEQIDLITTVLTVGTDRGARFEHPLETMGKVWGARTAGVDAVTRRHVEAGIGVLPFLEDLWSSLKDGTFTALPVRQVMIPKKRGKLRARWGYPFSGIGLRRWR